MTEAEFLEMPERERDAVVAENVMKWPFNLCRPFNGTGRREVRDGTLSEFCVKCGDPYGYHGGWPSYTTDIAAAWAVVEKMREEFLYPDIISKTTEWLCVVDKYEEEDEPIRWPVRAASPSAPLAICLAALKAKGVIA